MMQRKEDERTESIPHACATRKHARELYEPI